jgi:hypothetical protein
VAYFHSALDIREGNPEPPRADDRFRFRFSSTDSKAVEGWGDGVISGNVFGNDQILCGNVASTQWVFTPQIYCPERYPEIDE